MEDDRFRRKRLPRKVLLYEGELPFVPTKVWRHLTFEDFLDSLFCFSEVLPLGGKMP